MRYESIDRRCQAANFRHLRARDATLECDLFLSSS